RNLTVLGIVMAGDAAPDNEAAITRHGHTRILARLPRLSPLTPASVARASAGDWPSAPGIPRMAP
ncbi:MAG TPA: hypothetical protein VMB71_08615, partial [Acetobacteraceae bacterium]|nr:hypothetical protein [Acetobacteraceae bacterium]